MEDMILKVVYLNLILNLSRKFAIERHLPHKDKHYLNATNFKYLTLTFLQVRQIYIFQAFQTAEEKKYHGSTFRRLLVSKCY